MIPSYAPHPHPAPPLPPSEGEGRVRGLAPPIPEGPLAIFKSADVITMF